MSVNQKTPDLRFEWRFRDEGIATVAGLDEVGRGAWAGPVAAGAAILPLDRHDCRKALKGVRDSKKCTPRQRDFLDGQIRAVALATAVGMASTQEIDRIGIAAATRLAMQRAIENLGVAPQALLIDYIRLPEVGLPQVSFPKGEQRSLSIAAASIIAKVARDRLMAALDDEYPGYGLARHKGYGTPQHQSALRKLGPSPIHRHSFAPIRFCSIEETNEDRPRP